MLRALGRDAEARDSFERAIAIRERPGKEAPAVKGYRSSMAYTLRRRGLARRALGDRAGAAADARRALGLYEGLPSRTGAEGFGTACCRAALAGLAGVAGSTVAAAEGPEEAERAMALLRRAVAMGYRIPDLYRTEPALDPLRARPDFPLLLMDLAMPEEPFARGD